MSKAQDLEMEIMQKAQQLAALRREESGTEVPNYAFQSLNGEVRLSDLFGGQERLLMIHNMGQGCRYCTLWADGINGVIDHLENAMAVALVSKDPPSVQRQFALDRGWKFQIISHGGGSYMSEQCGMGEYENMPGAAIYEQEGGNIVQRGKTVFGPGDLYSPMWHFLSLAGLGQEDWTPQFHYWRRPEKLDDGGENVLD